MRMKYIGVLIFSLVTISASGQEFSVSTNIVGYLNLGTMNVEASYAPDRHWSLTASARYNPFSFSRDGQPMRHRQQSYSIGTRYWPWHIYSGWWVAAKLQYQEYSMGGVISPETEEGDRWGAGLTAGYTYMVHPHIVRKASAPATALLPDSGSFSTKYSASSGTSLSSGIPYQSRSRKAVRSGSPKPAEIFFNVARMAVNQLFVPKLSQFRRLSKFTAAI